MTLGSLRSQPHRGEQVPENRETRVGPWRPTSCRRVQGHTGGVQDETNVLGAELQTCGTDPVTGFYRDGCCSSDLIRPPIWSAQWLPRNS